MLLVVVYDQENCWLRSGGHELVDSAAVEGTRVQQLTSIAKSAVFRRRVLLLLSMLVFH